MTYQKPYALEAAAALPMKVLLGLVIQNTAGIWSVFSSDDDPLQTKPRLLRYLLPVSIPSSCNDNGVILGYYQLLRYH